MQVQLDIVAERFTAREKKIRALLRDYRTIDRRIEYLERLARGDELVHESRITAAPLDKFDAWEDLAQSIGATLEGVSASTLDFFAARNVRETPQQQETRENNQRIINELLPDKQLTYSTSYRIVRLLSDTKCVDEKDEDARKAIVAALEERIGEERVELTDTEQIAIIREQEIDEARQKLRTLREQREHIRFALETMEVFYPEAHTILWHYYVMDKPRPEVCKMAGYEWRTQQKTFEYHVRQAMQNFSKFVPAHVLTG